MAEVTICNDFGAQENKVRHCFHCFPIYLPWSDGTTVLARRVPGTGEPDGLPSMGSHRVGNDWSNLAAAAADGTRCYDLHFLNAEFQASFFTLLFHLKKLFSSSSLSANRVVSSAYLRLLIFLPAILIPACDPSSPTFRMMYSACKLNKQDNNI